MSCYVVHVNVYFWLNSAFRILYVISQISFRNTISYFIRWLHPAFHIPHLNPTLFRHYHYVPHVTAFRILTRNVTKCRPFVLICLWLFYDFMLIQLHTLHSLPTSLTINCVMPAACIALCPQICIQFTVRITVMVRVTIVCILQYLYHPNWCDN